MSEKITIRKIAAELGVAPATVYRVLSGRGSASLGTRRKVIRFARRYGYSLPEHKSGNVAVVVPGFTFFGYFGSMLFHLEKALHDAGFMIQLIPESDVAVLDDHVFDGVILLAWKSGEMLKLPEKYSIPVISLNAAYSVQDNIPLVASDGFGIERALNYLRSHGCLKIFFVGTILEKDPIAQERLEIFRLFCSRNGQPFENMHLALRGWDVAESVPQIIAQKADGVFCASETYGYRLAQAFRQAGIRIPEDISLMGMEYKELNSIVDPPITAIGQDFEKLANAAVLELIRAMEGKPAKNVRVPYTLIERNSVKILK
ncbi:MAG: LacI family DNA-binding transcriptional regulator [Lentisphaeria bacterium]|nr:LacI family DNA-binding transcriptional regulator [Lentisphaeria bacterium]